MHRKHLLMTAAAVALAMPAPASAIIATGCVKTGLQIVCTGLGNPPIDDSDDSLEISVETDASVVSPGDSDDIPTIAVQGDDVSIVNDGVIEHTADDNGGYAITSTGKRTTVTNRGAISSGDRGIEVFDEIEVGDDDVPTGAEDFTLVNEQGATIMSRRQAVRSAAPGATVENHGEIVAVEGRAVQVRGFGATVINSGLLEGGEEVVEARGGFKLENTGQIRIGVRNGALPDDEDGVQFAGGEVDNWGSIRGTDDGIDFDEGEIRNHAGAEIVTTGSGNGVDIDEVYDAEVERPNGLARIVNEGLIEGAKAVGVDDAAINPVEIVNSGVLRGRSGVAVELGAGQASSSLSLFGASEVYGDVIFGGGDDTLTIGLITSGVLIASEFDGGMGDNTVIFDGFGLGDFKSFDVMGDLVALSFMSNGDLLEGPFRNFQSWMVGGVSYDTAGLAAAVAAPVPVPAALPLLAAALGGLVALRRRR
jgi:hypothetical protein